MPVREYIINLYIYIATENFQYLQQWSATDGHQIFDYIIKWWVHKPTCRQDKKKQISVN